MKKLAKTLYDIFPFKKQVFTCLRPFHLPKSIYQHLHFKGVFTVKFDAYRFKIRHYGYQIENELFWSGLTNGWEKISMRLWIELCKSSQSIIDVGANTGVYSLVAKTVNPSASVHAFEPVERVYRKLIENKELNGFDFGCHEAALSNTDGTAVIYDTPTEHVYSVTVNKNTGHDRETVETRIRVKKLATFIKEQNISHIDLIKIDVETHEPEVLEGMGEYLEKFRPTMLIEILNDEVGSKVQELIKNLDYLYFNIDEISKPRLVSSISKSDYYNYLICKKEVAQALHLL